MTLKYKKTQYIGHFLFLYFVFFSKVVFVIIVQNIVEFFFAVDE